MWKIAKVMKAVMVSRFGGPEVLKLVCDVPTPTIQPNEVLVKVSAIGVNPVDTYIRAGKYPRLPSLPYIPGNDIAGTVVAVGEAVNGLHIGERVASFMNVRSGGYAEYCAVDPTWLLRLPDSFDLRKGAALGVPYLTAYRALFQKAKAKRGCTVLIHGASGGVGIAATQLAVTSGMRVIGTAGTEAGEKLVMSNGAEFVFNHKSSNYAEKVVKISDGGPNVILEMLSDVNLGKDLEMIGQNGCVCVIGCRGTIDINPRLIMAKESSVCGVALTNLSEKELLEIKTYIETALQSQTPPINPVIGVELALSRAEQAHYDIIASKAALGKMILVV